MRNDDGQNLFVMRRLGCPCVRVRNMTMQLPQQRLQQQQRQ